jgi:hypothetical protein
MPNPNTVVTLLTNIVHVDGHVHMRKRSLEISSNSSVLIGGMDTF